MQFNRDDIEQAKTIAAAAREYIASMRAIGVRVTPVAAVNHVIGAAATRAGAPRRSYEEVMDRVRKLNALHADAAGHDQNVRHRPRLRFHQPG